MSSTLYFDGASRGNPGPAAIGYRLQFDGETIEGAETIGSGTNNEAEYYALIEGLKTARGAGVECIEVRGDSELVVKQVRGEYSVNAENLQPLHDDVLSLLDQFTDWSIDHVQRTENVEADDLANAALDED